MTQDVIAIVSNAKTVKHAANMIRRSEAIKGKFHHCIEAWFEFEEAQFVLQPVAEVFLQWGERLRKSEQASLEIQR